MNNKILFISANTFKVPYPVYPLGVSYVNTYVKENLPGFQTRILDMNLITHEELAKEIKDFDPGMIGVSLRNADNVDSTVVRSFISGYLKIMETIRSSSKAKVIIGGSAFSVFPELIFRELKPDFAIVGEGEKSLVELINRLQDKKETNDIEGLVYYDDDKIVINPRENYFSELEVEFEDTLIDYYWQHSGMLNIQTKRGCPFHCIYCTYPLIEGSRVRTLNPEKTVDSLKQLSEKKNIDYVFFTDSVFNISNEFNIRLAKRMIDNKVNIKWGAYFTLKNLDKELLCLLKESGLTHIEFGTEALSNTTLKTYRKEFSVDDILRISGWCNELSINHAHFLILGGYGETEQSLNETFYNSGKIENSVFFPFVGMRIYPRTSLQKLAIEEGVISADDDLLLPKYYISPDMPDLSKLKEMAAKTGKRWVFPDEDMSGPLEKMRKKNKKGPLWEYLIR